MLDYIYFLNLQNLNQNKDDKTKLLIGLDSALVNMAESGKGYQWLVNQFKYKKNN